MNRYIKLFSKIIFLMFICFIINVNSYSVDAANLKKMQEQAKGFITNGEQSASKIDIDKAVGEIWEIGSVLTTIAVGEIGEIGSVLTTIGAGVMVAVVTYMGIKYLTAGPEAQAKLKTQLIGVIVSGAVIFVAYAIWKLVVGIAMTF